MGVQKLMDQKYFLVFVLVVVILYDAAVVDHVWSGPGALEAVQTPAAITSTNSFSILLLTISLGVKISPPSPGAAVEAARRRPLLQIVPCALQRGQLVSNRSIAKVDHAFCLFRLLTSSSLLFVKAIIKK